MCCHLGTSQWFEYNGLRQCLLEQKCGQPRETNSKVLFASLIYDTVFKQALPLLQARQRTGPQDQQSHIQEMHSLCFPLQ